jgi:hypothetical protein
MTYNRINRAGKLPAASRGESCKDFTKHLFQCVTAPAEEKKQRGIAKGVFHEFEPCGGIGSFQQGLQLTIHLGSVEFKI